MASACTRRNNEIMKKSKVSRETMPAVDEKLVVNKISVGLRLELEHVGYGQLMASSFS